MKNPGETVPLLPDILHLTYFDNSGAAFSSFNDVRPLLILIGLGQILFAITVTFLISQKLSKSDKKIIKPLQVGVGLFLAGGISNTVERILFNGVVVFIDFRLYQIAIFNFADVFIVIGCWTTVISLIFLGLEFTFKKSQR